jgi:hypothetical protein
VPGHDACRLERRRGGWRLEGVATFLHAEGPAWLRYVVECDAGWRSRAGLLEGRVGSRRVRARIRRSRRGWTLDGVAVPGLKDCEDLDFGFTPSTNLFQIRRLGLGVGEAADCPVAWLDVGTGLRRLPQRYERRTTLRYRYAAPTVPYAGVLDLLPTGFARRYGRLWAIEGA